MNYKWISALIILAVLFIGGVNAYSGFNRYYYTDYYAPAVYYQTPYNVPTYYSTSYYNTAYYYPTTTYVDSYYYPAYNTVNYYYPSYTYYTPTIGNYSGLSMYKNDSGWGISVSRGNICGLYGYC
ncbi:MAG TPA: hypothetical protein PKK60_01995 [archaeon]|nr:hypothetical protein [archaeon]